MRTDERLVVATLEEARELALRKNVSDGKLFKLFVVRRIADDSSFEVAPIHGLRAFGRRLLLAFDDSPSFTSPAASLPRPPTELPPSRPRRRPD